MQRISSYRKILFQGSIVIMLVNAPGTFQEPSWCHNNVTTMLAWEIHTRKTEDWVYNIKHPSRSNTGSLSFKSSGFVLKSNSTTAWPGCHRWQLNTQHEVWTEDITQLTKQRHPQFWQELPQSVLDVWLPTEETKNWNLLLHCLKPVLESQRHRTHSTANCLRNCVRSGDNP